MEIEEDEAEVVEEEEEMEKEEEAQAVVGVQRKKGKGKERERVEENGEEDETRWYYGPGLQGFPEDKDIHSLYDDPQIKIMRYILGQGKCNRLQTSPPLR